MEGFTEAARIGLLILRKTLEIIRYFEGKNKNLQWCFENPRGFMRHTTEVIGMDWLPVTIFCRERGRGNTGHPGASSLQAPPGVGGAFAKGLALRANPRRLLSFHAWPET